MKEKEVWLQCYPPVRTGARARTSPPPHTYTPLSTQRFLVADMKEFRTQGTHYGPFVVLDQTLLFSP